MNVKAASLGGTALDLRYELGNPTKPRGHALLYFRQPSSNVTIATYLVVLPVTLDIARYMPPMFAASMPMMGESTLGAMPIPPVPEVVDSVAALERLANTRDDDLIYGGDVAHDAPEGWMRHAAEAAQRYADAYRTYLATVPAVLSPVPELSEEDAVYSAMTEADRVGELARLLGTLRYASEGHDMDLQRDTRRRLHTVGTLLPGKYRVNELALAAQKDDPDAVKLTELLLDRCFMLLREEYEALPDLELRIRALREG